MIVIGLRSTLISKVLTNETGKSIEDMHYSNRHCSDNKPCYIDNDISEHS